MRTEFIRKTRINDRVNLPKTNSPKKNDTKVESKKKKIIGENKILFSEKFFSGLIK